MAVSSSYYINGPSIGSATAVFTDSSLLICAPDGFYSDGVISREQVDCVLLPQQTCPSCVVSYPHSLGYSEIDCAGACSETPVTYYSNCSDLVLYYCYLWTDSELTIEAPAGYYSNGVDCYNYLYPHSGFIAITSCAVPCGDPIVGSGSRGIYNIDLSLGTATGAVIVTFNPQSIPDGILSTLNSIQYNKLSSPTEGVLQSSIAGATYVGLIGGTGGCAWWYPSGGTLGGLSIFNWDGTTFVDSGTTTSLTIATPQIQLTASTPGFCVMVIPKITSSDLTLNVQAIGPCTTTGWNINVTCPAPLPSFSSSSLYATPSISCSASMSNTYYFAKVHTAVDSYLGIYDYVFSDQNGETPLPDGYYLISNVATPNQVMQIADGVIVAFTNCI